MSTRGDQRQLYTLYKRKGNWYLELADRPMNITLKYSAPAVGNFAAYREIKTYKLRNRS